MELPAPSAGPVLPGQGTKVGWAESTEGTRGGVLVGDRGKTKDEKGRGGHRRHHRETLGLELTLR